MINKKINKKIIICAADWLLLSQKKTPDKCGYSRSYSLLLNKWDNSYIETTGYIIPTLIKVGKIFKKKIYIKSALKAGLWLIKKQNKDGSFNDIDKNIPHVFDTGQCVHGLTSLFKLTKNNLFKNSSIKACYWLIEKMNSNGSWTNFSYNKIAHSYYSLVSLRLIEAGIFFNKKKFINYGLKNINWVLLQQKKNGFFLKSTFKNENKYLLHTMMYVLEGLIGVYNLYKKKNTRINKKKYGNFKKN